MIEELTPGEFLQRHADGERMTLLDVREEWEVKLSPAPVNALHIPMGDIPQRLGELDANATTVVLCRSGARSMQVAHFLAAQGFGPVFNLAGGILAWSRDIDPSITRY